MRPDADVDPSRSEGVRGLRGGGVVASHKTRGPDARPDRLVLQSGVQVDRWPGPAALHEGRDGKKVTSSRGRRADGNRPYHAASAMTSSPVVQSGSVRQRGRSRHPGRRSSASATPGAAVALSQVTGRKRAMTAPSQASRRQYESVGDAAARVGVSTKTVRRWIASGQLAGYRVGPRLLRVDPDDLDRMLRLIPAARAI